MILHARDPLFRKFRVWHVPTCSRLKNVVWVDDDTMRWAVFDIEAARIECREVEIQHQAKLIKIIPHAFMVLIDPVEDDDNFVIELANEIVGRMEKVIKKAAGANS